MPLGKGPMRRIITAITVSAITVHIFTLSFVAQATPAAGAVTGHVPGYAGESAALSPRLDEAGVSALRVQENKLVNAAGQRVILHGVNYATLAFACVGGYGIFGSP